MSRTWMVGTALVLLAACGRGAPGDQPPPPAEPGRPPSNWEVPLHGGRIVASVTQAAHYVHFTVREPRFAIRPALIQVDDPAQVSVDERTVAFVDHLPASGTVVVEERSSHLTLADLRRRADAPGVAKDAFQMVPVRSTPGLLVSASSIGSLIWIEVGVLFDITGPSVSPSQVQARAARSPTPSSSTTSPLGRLLGDPRRGAVGLFLDLRNVFPHGYPLNQWSLPDLIRAEGRLARALDYGIISSRLAELYAFAAVSLEEPSLAAAERPLPVGEAVLGASISDRPVLRIVSFVSDGISSLQPGGGGIRTAAAARDGPGSSRPGPSPPALGGNDLAIGAGALFGDPGEWLELGRRQPCNQREWSPQPPWGP